MTLDTHCVLVDLDCLLDTRLGCLAQYDENLAAEVVKDRKYHERVQDDFPGMPYAQFKELCKRRNVETLKNSFQTNVFEFLHLVAQSRVQECNEHNQPFQMDLVINTYPYNLTDEETAAIIQVVEAKMAALVRVRAERWADGFLTPKFCKENFQVMMKYWWEEWVESQMKNFETTTMPAVTFFAPALYDKMPTPEDLNECERVQLKPFQVSEKAFAPLFALRVLDARIFSIIDVPA